MVKLKVGVRVRLRARVKARVRARVRARVSLRVSVRVTMTYNDNGHDNENGEVRAPPVRSSRASRVANCRDSARLGSSFWKGFLSFSAYLSREFK